MKRRYNLDERGVPYGQSIELSQEDLQQRNYSLLRLIFLLPLLALGYLAFGAVAGFGWHPVFQLAVGFGIPIIGGAILHFVPWMRLIYDGAITVACAIAAFLLVQNAQGGDMLWGAGAAVVTLLIGAWMTYADLRGTE